MITEFQMTATTAPTNAEVDALFESLLADEQPITDPELEALLDNFVTESDLAEAAAAVDTYNQFVTYTNGKWAVESAPTAMSMPIIENADGNLSQSIAGCVAAIKSLV